MESRTIRVKGTGSASFKPDFIEVSMYVTASHAEYDMAMVLATKYFDNIGEVIVKAGFSADDLKTSSFDVSAKYEYLEVENTEKRVLTGYDVSNRLHLYFDKDMERLNFLLSSLSKSMAHPQVEVKFTVKDKNAVSDTLLRDAAQDARQKAALLCEASGVKLGQLLNIDYSWGEIDLYSRCTYESGRYREVSYCGAPEITPDDIKVSDTATFIWEIH